MKVGPIYYNDFPDTNVNFNGDVIPIPTTPNFLYLIDEINRRLYPDWNFEGEEDADS
jgi:hypothetical protein